MSEPFGPCRLMLSYFTAPCANPATGPDELCDECRDELRAIARCQDDDDCARGYHDDRDFGQCDADAYPDTFPHLFPIDPRD